jgi:DNA-binding NarL/FixJ family response regulator
MTADDDQPGRSLTATSDPGDTTVLVVDDHRTFGDLLAAALNSIAGMCCIGTATSATDGVALAAQRKPDVVVMDIQMPRQDGLQATRQIREVAPNSVIAVLTAHTDPEWVARAAQAGASAFIPKDGSLDQMIDVLRRVRPGQMLVAPSVFSGRLRTTPIAPSEPHQQLTARELAVLQLLGQGVSTTGIAHVLGITIHTCRGYVKNLHTKLGVRSQLEAVVKAQQLGLINSQ